jgi:AraC-like DNA-binding protein
MKAQYEKVRYSESSIVSFEREDPEFPFFWHFHPEFELTLIIDSDGQRLVGDGIADYGRGDLVLLGPQLPHSWRSVPGIARVPRVHRALVIQFRPDFLGEKFLSLKEFAPVESLLKRAASGLAFGHTAIGKGVSNKLIEFQHVSPAQRILLLLSTLVELASDPAAQRLSTGHVTPTCRIEDQKRIDAICEHLHQHYDEEIDYVALSRCFHMDQASLCRFFKRATGRTMTTYVNEYRVGAATQLLLESDESLLDIAFRVGFGNYSHFHRQFKLIKGYSPRALRKQFQSDGALALIPALSQL